MNTRPLSHLETYDSAAAAAQALDQGMQALVAAERSGASEGEVIRLCDEVIARRLRVQLIRLRSGWSAPPQLAAQLARDRLLLEEPANLYN